jgi:hypothetical protein
MTAWISSQGRDSNEWKLQVMSPSTSLAGNIVQRALLTKNRSERVLSATTCIFVKKSEHNNQMDDAAAVEWCRTLSHHCRRRASITVGMRATMTAAAGNTDERHRIADEDGQGQRWGESHWRKTRRLRNWECCDNNDMTMMHVMQEGEQRKGEEEREEEWRAMRRQRLQGCDDGIDEPRERGDGAEPEQAKQGRCNNGVSGEEKWLCEGARRWSTQAGQKKGCDSGTAVK